MQQTHYIIDGYSLLHRKHPGQLGNKAELNRCREALIREIDQWLPAGNRATLVFDGQQFSRAAQSRSGAFHIVYTKANQSADAYIERLCHEQATPEQFTVISNDRAVIELAAAAACSIQSCGVFLDELARQVRSQVRKRKQVNQQAKGPTLGDFFPDEPK